jgi:hypothetical protein
MFEMIIEITYRAYWLVDTNITPVFNSLSIKVTLTAF